MAERALERRALRADPFGELLDFARRLRRARFRGGARRRGLRESRLLKRQFDTHAVQVGADVARLDPQALELPFDAHDLGAHRRQVRGAIGRRARRRHRRCRGRRDAYRDPRREAQPRGPRTSVQSFFHKLLPSRFVGGWTP